MDLGFCPEERSGGFVVVGDDDLDMSDEFGDALKRDAFERFCREDREPDFDLIEPGGMRRREVEMDVLVAFQPHVAFGLVR